MKAFNTILKIATALAAVAGIAFVAYKYWDKITEKLGALKSKCSRCCAPEEEADDVEEVPVEEAAEAAEAPTEEAAPSEEPVVTEADFAD